MRIHPILCIGLLVIATFMGCRKIGEPVLLSIDPQVGAEGTLVTVKGENLANVESITFSGKPINFNTAYNSDVAILFRITQEIPTGLHDVVITTPGGSIQTQFRVTLEAPQIFKVEPEFAAPGDTVKITGVNFFEPLQVFFFDSIQANIIRHEPDSIVWVEVPVGAEKGPITLVSDGQDTISPKDFFTRNVILVSDFDGNGLRKETNRWVFVGSVNQNAQNAVQNSNPAPYSQSFLKLSGKDNLNIQWIGGAQNNFGFPGDTFTDFGITSTLNNTLMEMEVNNNGKDKTYVILILLENGGSPNDFTYKVPINQSGWNTLSIPLSRFTDLNDVQVDPAKIKVLKIHLYDETKSNQLLEVNVDNIRFVEIF